MDYKDVTETMGLVITSAAGGCTTHVSICIPTLQRGNKRFREMPCELSLRIFNFSRISSRYDCAEFLGGRFVLQSVKWVHRFQ